MNPKNTSPSIFSSAAVDSPTMDSSEEMGTGLCDYPTPDSYDPHIIPAETAVRKENEGKHFKHLSTHLQGPDNIATSGGFTVDKEGLIDNFGIEPEIYYDKPGDLPTQKSKKS